MIAVFTFQAAGCRRRRRRDGAPSPPTPQSGAPNEPEPVNPRQRPAVTAWASLRQRPRRAVETESSMAPNFPYCPPGLRKGVSGLQTGQFEANQSRSLTFDDVTEYGGPELLLGSLVEVLPVDNAHLLEEGGLAALARSEQQDLHQPLDCAKMTIRTVRPDRGQHFHPRMHCLKKLEATVVEMQDPKTGVKGSEQKLNVTTIPHVIAGNDIIAWITNKMKVTQEEAGVFGTMLVAYGYVYPLQNHKKLVMCNDGSLYRFQTPYFWPKQNWFAEDSDYAIYLTKRNIRKKGMLEAYEQAHYNHLNEWLNHQWDFIVMQATEQYKAGKDRQKPDRVVLDCQERAYWIVNRPPRRTHSALDSSPERLINPKAEQKITFDQYRRMNIFYQQAIMRSKVKSSVSLGALVKFITTYKNHDPFLAPCLPSNPWQTDHDAYWTLNMRRVEVPTKMRVERWSFSLFELLTDLRGRDDFKIFLKKEFSGENLAFWEAAEELKWGASSSMSAKAETIFKTFLAPGAPRWINIDGRTMGLTVKGLDHPHRYVLEAAQTHVFMLMKKDTFFRYLKSPTYKDIQKKALNPEAHNFSPAQLEQNAQNRNPGIDPIILWQQDEEEKAKAAAASAPVDVKAMMSKIDRKK